MEEEADENLKEIFRELDAALESLNVPIEDWLHREESFTPDEAAPSPSPSSSGRDLIIEGSDVDQVEDDKNEYGHESEEINLLETSIVSLQEELEASFAAEEAREISYHGDDGDDDDMSLEQQNLESSVLSLRNELSALANIHEIPPDDEDDDDGMVLEQQQLESNIRSLRDELSNISVERRAPATAKASPAVVQIDEEQEEETTKKLQEVSFSDSNIGSGAPPPFSPMQNLSAITMDSPDLAFHDSEQNSPSPIKFCGIQQDLNETMATADLLFEADRLIQIHGTTNDDDADIAIAVQTCTTTKDEPKSLPPQELPTPKNHNLSFEPEKIEKSSISSATLNPSSTLERVEQSGKTSTRLKSLYTKKNKENADPRKRKQLRLSRLFKFGKSGRKKRLSRKESQLLEVVQEDQAATPTTTNVGSQLGCETKTQTFFEEAITADRKSENEPSQKMFSSVNSESSQNECQEIKKNDSSKPKTSVSLEVIEEQEELCVPAWPSPLSVPREVALVETGSESEESATAAPKRAMKKVIRMLGEARRAKRKAEKQNKKLLKMITDSWRDKQQTREAHLEEISNIVQKMEGEYSSLEQKYTDQLRVNGELNQNIADLKNQHSLKMEEMEQSLANAREEVKMLHKSYREELQSLSAKDTFLERMDTGNTTATSRRKSSKGGNRFLSKLPSPREAFQKSRSPLRPSNQLSGSSDRSISMQVTPSKRFPTKIPSPRDLVNSSMEGVHLIKSPPLSMIRSNKDKENSAKKRFTPTRMAGHQHRSPVPASVSSRYTRSMR